METIRIHTDKFGDLTMEIGAPLANEVGVWLARDDDQTIWIPKGSFPTLIATLQRVWGEWALVALATGSIDAESVTEDVPMVSRPDEPYDTLTETKEAVVPWRAEPPNPAAATPASDVVCEPGTRGLALRNSDDWTVCAPAECPLTLRVGDWVCTAHRGEGRIVSVDSRFSRTFLYLVEWSDGVTLWPARSTITAYRRTRK